MVNFFSMTQIADRKLHFAPYARQERAIAKLLREGRFRNTTDFLRKAIDHYLDRLGRPTLAEQAREMAAEYGAGGLDVADLQADSMETDEEW